MTSRCATCPRFRARAKRELITPGSRRKCFSTPRAESGESRSHTSTLAIFIVEPDEPVIVDELRHALLAAVEWRVPGREQG